MREFDETVKKISQNVQRVYSKSFGPVSEASAMDAQARLIELFNPSILTEMHKIVIQGKVFAVSRKELIKVMKTRYITPGPVNVFPAIVEDFLKTGKSSEISKLNQYDINQALSEMRVLSRIASFTKKESMVFLKDVDPLTPVTEYIIDGKHTSGIPLRSVEIPAAVISDSANFQFNSTLGAKISDGRVEKNMVIELVRPEIYIEGVEDNIITTGRGKAGSYPDSYSGDLLSIAAILLSGIGIVFIIARGRLWEIGVPMMLLGIVFFYLRYFSDWAKDKFGPGETEIYGDAPVRFQFYGELS